MTRTRAQTRAASGDVRGHDINLGRTKSEKKRRRRGSCFELRSGSENTATPTQYLRKLYTKICVTIS